VAILLRNGWPLCIGISGQIASEYAGFPSIGSNPDFHTSFLRGTVFVQESHSSKVALLNLQRPLTFKAGINPFFAKREMVRT
jgi:hypothetical protein